MKQPPTPFFILHHFQRLEKTNKFLFLPSIYWNFSKSTLFLASYVAYNILFTISSFYFIIDFYATDFSSQLNLETLLMLFMFIANTTFFLTGLKLFFCRNAAISRIYRTMSDVQNELERMAGRPKIDKNLICSITLVVYLCEGGFCIQSVCALVHYLAEMNVRDGLAMWMFSYSQLLQGLFVLRLCLKLCALQQLFRLINANILQLQKGEEVEKLRRVHRELVELVKADNQLYSAGGLTLAFFYQIIFLFFFYNVHTLGMGAFENLGYIFYAWVCLVKVLLVAFLAERCRYEGLLLIKLNLGKMICTRNVSKVVQKELNSFNCQLLHDDFTIKAGFYDFGGPFLFSYFADIATRIVIIMQF